MIVTSLKHAYDLTRHIGCCLITVDAKLDATGFYEKYSFLKVKKQIHPDIVAMYLNLTQYIKANSEWLHKDNSVSKI